MFGHSQEDADYEFNARYDYIREAYAATARDCDAFAESDAAYYDEVNRLRADLREGNLVLTLDTFYVEETYNFGVKATIPPCWKATVMEDVDDLLDDGAFCHHHVEGIGRTEQDAIVMLVGQLQSLGLHGKLRRAK